MQQVELNYLVDKQLTELLVKAAVILSGEYEDADIEAFYTHSAGVKRFMGDYVLHTGIRKFLDRIPHIDYKKTSRVQRYILMMPFFADMRKKHEAFQQIALDGIKDAFNIYSTIFYLHEEHAA